MSALIVLAALLSLVPLRPVAADTGVVEISQAAVTAGGGFPYVIAAPGSYRLTSALAVVSPGVPALEVTADGVTIDLNGFSITGAGDSAGVDAGSASDVNVRNGYVTAFSTCVLLGSGGSADLLVVHGCAKGIQVGAESTVTRSLSFGHGFEGIVLGAGDAQVLLNRVSQNGDDGIQALAGSGNVIRRNMLIENSPGVTLSSSSSTVSENVIEDNAESGMDALVDSLVVERNVFAHNQSYGLRVDDGATIRQNVFFDNGNRSVLLDTGNTLIGNLMHTVGDPEHLSTIGTANLLGYNMFQDPGQCTNAYFVVEDNYCRSTVPNGFNAVCTFCAE